MVKYTVWGKFEKEGTEFTVVEGEQLPAWDTRGQQLLKVIEAESFDDAMRQYYEWQGWGTYKPMDDPPKGH
jgi:hypothetical protein